MRTAELHGCMVLQRIKFEIFVKSELVFFSKTTVYFKGAIVISEFSVRRTYT